jgi:CxxC motif-containing protein (DUF1111 family)
MTLRCRRLFCGLILCLFTAIFIPANGGTGAEPDTGKAKAKPGAADISGRELFLREWIPNDPRSHGGDGLGPVFNDTSCVSCHNQGGVGGGGAEAKNVVVITAFLAQPQMAAMAQATQRNGGQQTPKPADAAPGSPDEQAKLERQKKEKEREELLAELRKLHPGLAAARSVVLHKSGTDPTYSEWRDQVLALAQIFQGAFANENQNGEAAAEGDGFFGNLLERARQQKARELQPPRELQAEKVRGIAAVFGAFAFQRQPGDGRRLIALPSQRNATALFGAGLIDSIPDKVLEAAAATKHPDFPEISGRVARLKDGKIGRFGWKSQKSSLHEFTMTACAVELGLNVPDHPQAGSPQSPEYQPAGFDLNQDECLALVQFLKDLPAPDRHGAELAAVADEIGKGEQLFTKIGCAACHQADLGEVRGVYSDLLLHDMGPENGDSGSYGVFQPQSSGSDAEDPLAGLVGDTPQMPFQSVFQPNAAQENVEEQIPDKMIGAGRQEWRTPPLWGVRDSAPYLHDGRARSLEQAVAFHGGEGQMSANRFFRLKAEERAQVLTFLRSLVAPATLN